jgi:hypothetical protein
MDEGIGGGVKRGGGRRYKEGDWGNYGVRMRCNGNRKKNNWCKE